MDNITFTSAIRPIKSDKFRRIIDMISAENFVDYPWTCRESRKASEAYTVGILDCTMCGITDGKDVFMMHICPTTSENSDFLAIKKYITDRVDLNNKNLRALVLGAKENPSKYSTKLFDKFVKLLTKYKIPTTSLRGGNIYETVDVAYKSANDEWLISSYYFDEFIKKESPGTVLNKIFKTIKVADGDVITY